MTGVKSLLDAADTGVSCLAADANDHQVREHKIWSRARRATFWNLAREDYLAAYINHSATRLDANDISLWRAAGLLIADDGSIAYSGLEKSDQMEISNEDMISNTLVWMLARIMNFLAAGGNVNLHLTPQDTPTQLSSDQQDQPIARPPDRYAEWDKLRRGVNEWFQKLPCTFRPCARINRPPPTRDGAGSGPSFFFEIYFSIPMYAASIQHYHFACIILLLNQPTESLQGQTIGDRLRRYRQISEKVDHHAREICGIALANPPGAVRIHMLQPLYLAGFCLEHREERQTISDLLRGIEADLGWVTGYRVDQLKTDWNWDNG